MVNIRVVLDCVWILVSAVFTLSMCKPRRPVDTWQHVSVRFGFWISLPSSQPLASKAGYKRLNDVCKTDNYHGFLFYKGSNRKPRPIYDLNLNLAGVQLSIPGNMRTFNSLNQTADVLGDMGPPVLKGFTDKKGVLHYIVTAYFKHPSLICSPFGVDRGRGLYIQMGYNPVLHHLQVPLHSSDLPTQWVPGSCRPQMGTHYFMNLSPSMPCEKLYPLFLMYDIEGNLGAFGWMFQGRPNNYQAADGFHLTPATYPLIFDRDMLPSCMFYEQFQVFGIHVYLRNSTKLICTKDVPAPENVNKKHSVHDTQEVLVHEHNQGGPHGVPNDRHPVEPWDEHGGSGVESETINVYNKDRSSTSASASVHIGATSTVYVSWILVTCVNLLFMSVDR